MPKPHLLTLPAGLALLGLALAAASSPDAAAQTSAPSAPSSPLVGAAVAAISGDAPFYRNSPARLGYFDTALPMPLSVAWQNTTTPFASNLSAPVAHDGVIFFGSGPSVYAVNTDNGALRWSYTAPPTVPLHDASLDANGIKEASEQPFDCPPAVADGKVFIGNDDGKLYVFDEKTGASLWQFPTGGAVRSAPVVDNGVVFFGSLDSRLYAIREVDQKPVWGGEFRSAGPITTPPAIGRGSIFFGDANNTLYNVNEASGRINWSERFGVGVSDSPPQYVANRIIVGAMRDVYGVATDEGEQAWHVTLPSTLSAQVALSPDASTIYAATNDARLVCASSRNHINWAVPLDSIAKAAPVLTRNTVIVVSQQGIITALDASTGAVRWTYSMHSIRPPAQITITKAGLATSTPLVANGQLYTLYCDGTLTAFSPDAVDSTKPTATLLYPTTSAPVSGEEVPYYLTVNDAGSGIDPSTLTLKVDGVLLPVEYSPGLDLVQVKMTTSAGVIGQVPVHEETLTPNQHTLTLHIADWRGNALDQSWQFVVYGIPLADTGPTGPAGTTVYQGNEPPAGQTGGQGGPVLGGGGTRPGGTGGGAGAGSGSGSGAGSSSGGGGSTRGGGGGTSGGGGRTPPPPIAAPPGTGGNFPPPPPI